MNLNVLVWEYSMYQFDVHAQIPTSIFQHLYYFVWKNKQELSVFCMTDDLIKSSAKASLDHRKIFELEWEFEFTEDNIGITAKLYNILADAWISLCFVWTYATDYVMVQYNDFGKACAAFEKHWLTIQH